MNLHPFIYCVRRVSKLLFAGNAYVLQKFLCAKCSNVLTMEEANAFYTHGTCDKCGWLTNIQEDGCNYMLLISNALAQTHTLGVKPPKFKDRLTIYDSNQFLAKSKS